MDKSSRLGIPRPKPVLQSFAEFLSEEVKVKKPEKFLFSIERDHWFRIRNSINIVELNYLLGNLKFRVPGRLTLLQSNSNLCIEGRILPFEILNYYFDSPFFIPIEEAIHKFKEDFSLEIDDAVLLQSCVLVFELMLKKYFSTLDLKRAYALPSNGKIELTQLIEMAQARIFKNQLPINSIMLLTLAYTVINDLSNALLTDLFVFEILQMDLQIDPRLKELLLARQNNGGHAVNLYGHQGESSDFDIRFREFLIELLDSYYNSIRKENFDKFRQVVVEKLNSLLRKYTYFEQRADGDNRIFARDLNSFMEAIYSIEMELPIEEISNEDKEAMLLKYFNINTNSRIKIDKDKRENAVKSFFSNVSNKEDARLLDIDEDIARGTLSYYRGSIMIILIITYPDVAKLFNFSYTIETKDSSYWIRVKHPHFTGFGMRVSSMFLEKFLTKETTYTEIREKLDELKKSKFRYKFTYPQILVFGPNIENIGESKRKIEINTIQSQLDEIMRLAKSSGFLELHFEAARLWSIASGELHYVFIKQES